MFYKDERLALFIDGSNLYAAAKSLGFDIDYKLLRMEFMRRGKLLRAFYYTALLESEEYSPIRPLVDWLNYNGFAMVTKPAKEFTDSTGRRKVKGNMDIELAVDAMEMAPHVDHIVLRQLLGGGRSGEQCEGEEERDGEGRRDLGHGSRRASTGRRAWHDGWPGGAAQARAGASALRIAERDP